MAERAPGELERAVIEVLWSAHEALTARTIIERLAARTPRALARSTVLTVLSRLEGKGLILRSRESGVYVYRAAASREEHIADVMRDVLDRTPDRSSALAHFVDAANPSDLSTLRGLLRRIDAENS